MQDLDYLAKRHILIHAERQISYTATELRHTALVPPN